VNYKVVGIVFIAACFLLLFSIGGSLWDGSFGLFLHDGSWKFPETPFIFWLIMSQAGVLLSVFMLIMNVRIHRRTSLLLELSSLCCLVVSIFYSIFCSSAITIESNVYGIGILGFMSLLFFATHLAAADSAENVKLCRELSKIRRPLAWIMLPTIFWVAASLSLDYARVENPVWMGSFFPLYVVACVFYSGFALLIALLSFENYYNRLMERFLVLSSWFMAILFFWMYHLKGEGCLMSLVFACAVPQLFFIGFIRENLWGRLLVSVCILFGILLKCDFMVNLHDAHFFSNLSFADAGILFMGVAMFVAIFLAVRFLLSRFFENDEILMGEEDETTDGEFPVAEPVKTYSPFSAPEFKVVRLPVLCGIMAGVVYGYWTSDWVNLAEPIAAYVSCVLVCLQPFIHMVFSKRRGRK
jgi:hypothetical protein